MVDFPRGEIPIFKSQIFTCNEIHPLKISSNIKMHVHSDSVKYQWINPQIEIVDESSEIFRYPATSSPSLGKEQSKVPGEIDSHMDVTQP